MCSREWTHWGKRPDRLPRILTRQETTVLLNSAEDFRESLLLALMQEGKCRFSHDAYLFPGRRPGGALSTRMAERIVRRCAKRAGLPRHVTSMVLRHTCAVQALEAGVNIRDLQVRLGHASVETTMLYQRCLTPEETTSPLDTMSATPTTPHDTSPPPAATQHPMPGTSERLRQRLTRWFHDRLGPPSG